MVRLNAIRGAKMTKEEVIDKVAKGESLNGFDLSYADLSDVNLRGTDLSGAKLRNADLRNANLTGADLAYAYLAYANLRRANLSDSDLSGAYLFGANLTSSDLRNANLRGANLSDSELTGANLNSADLRDAYLSRVNLSRGIGIAHAPSIDPRGYQSIFVVYADGLHIQAGCRNFTLDEAEAHWGDRYTGDRDIGDMYLEVVKYARHIQIEDGRLTLPMFRFQLSGL